MVKTAFAKSNLQFSIYNFQFSIFRGEIPAAITCLTNLLQIENFKLQIEN